MRRHYKLSAPLRVLPVAALAACGGTLALPPGEPDATPAAELARAVSAHLAPNDFEDPDEEFLHVEARGDLVFVRGVIDTGSRRRVHSVLTDNPDARVVVFTAIAGSADDEANLAMGRMLREAAITTYLPARGFVASGGTDLFLSGARRILETGARVGVHSWADSDGSSGDAIPRDHPDHEIYLGYYREMGIPPDFYWFTLRAAPPEDIHWMSRGELEQYVIFTEAL